MSERMIGGNNSRTDAVFGLEFQCIQENQSMALDDYPQSREAALEMIR